MKKQDPLATIWWDLGPSFGGGYSTDALVHIEHYLAQQGASRAARRKVYAPFIIAGPAEFSDTWGSVRHSDGDRLRPHLGQDVFCQAGAEVLAAESGRVELKTDRLGGTVVRLHRAGGGYWYYAHLSGYPEGLSSGETVKMGDVIGYCGNSGNAAGGAPHVHFGSYPGPENPMGALIGWLGEAESQGKTVFKRREAKSTGVGTAVFVYDKDLVEPCFGGEVAQDDPLELLLTASR